MIFLLAALVILAYVAGALTEKWRRRPPEVPSTAYFLERDREPVDEAEHRRRTAREAIEDWREAYERPLGGDGTWITDELVEMGVVLRMRERP